MQVCSTLRSFNLFLLLCGTAVILSSCSDDTTTDPTLAGTFYSAAQDVGDGSARTYVTLNDDGNPTAVGIRMTADALVNLPADGPEVSFLFQLPTEAASTVFDNVSLDWNPHGHDPDGLFDVPHFDMHFYMINADEKAEIDPAETEKANNLPSADYMPEGYFTPAPEAVPNMGVHLLDSQDPPVAGEFTEVFIYGCWDGDIVFMEPMITLEWLGEKPSLLEDIKLPAKYQRSGYYPTTYSVEYDEAADEYVIELGGMVMRNAS